MSNTAHKTNHNSKLPYIFGLLAIACATASIYAEIKKNPDQAAPTKEPAYLKNCALKTALERPER